MDRILSRGYQDSSEIPVCLLQEQGHRIKPAGTVEGCL